LPLSTQEVLSPPHNRPDSKSPWRPFCPSIRNYAVLQPLICGILHVFAACKQSLEAQWFYRSTLSAMICLAPRCCCQTFAFEMTRLGKRCAEAIGPCKYQDEYREPEAKKPKIPILTMDQVSVGCCPSWLCNARR